MKIKKLLVIAAHPDDELLGCGGTIAKFISGGVQIKILFLGEGSTCRFDNASSGEALSAINVRNLCAEKALQKLEVSDFEFSNLPCGRFDQIPIIEINKIIERAIKTFKPDTIFTHSEVDSNNDHKITHRSTIMATRPCGDHIVTNVFVYEVPSSSEWSFSQSFVPNYFVSLTDAQLALKWNALECYKGEMRDYPFPRSWLSIEALARFRGVQSGNDFAEAFQLIRGFA